MNLSTLSASYNQAHAPTCPCLECLRKRGSGGLFGSFLIAAAQVVIPLLMTPRHVEEVPLPEPLDPLDPVTAAKRVPCEVVQPEEAPRIVREEAPRILQAASPRFVIEPRRDLELKQPDPEVTAPPATVSPAMAGTTIILDVEIATYPRCSACKHPYVLRRALVHVGGDILEQWSWWRDCKDKDAGAEIVDNRPKAPAKKPKKPKRTKDRKP